MKKFVVTILVITLVSNLEAQVSIGLKGGTSFASIKLIESSQSMNSSSDKRTAFMLGGYTTISISKKLKLQPEILYQGMGGSVDNTTFNSDYISVPVLLKFGLANNFYLEAGPQFSLLVSSKTAVEDIKTKFNSSDFQVLVGASFNLTSKIGAGARYGMGMSNIASSSFKTNVKTDIRNSAFTVMVNYKLL